MYWKGFHVLISVPIKNGDLESEATVSGFFLERHKMFQSL